MDSSDQFNGFQGVQNPAVEDGLKLGKRPDKFHEKRIFFYPSSDSAVFPVIN
jgi:hypothetical protein